MVSLGWAFLNLLPILPLDGGLVARRILGHPAGRRGELAALVLSIVTARTIRTGHFGLKLDWLDGPWNQDGTMSTSSWPTRTLRPSAPSLGSS